MTGRRKPPTGSAPRARRLWRGGDLLAAAVVLAAALVSAALLFWPRPAGEVAVIQTPAGEQTVSLRKDTVVEVAGEGGISLTIEVAAGRVRVLSSDCPDQVCVHTGWLSHEGDAAACVPAGVSVRVAGGEESPIDAVVR